MYASTVGYFFAPSSFFVDHHKRLPLNFLSVILAHRRKIYYSQSSASILPVRILLGNTCAFSFISRPLRDKILLLGGAWCSLPLPRFNYFLMEMLSRRVRIPRLLLLVFSIIVVFFVLRALLKVSFGLRTESGEIRILTYNIWYSSEKMEERIEALGQVVQDLQPDFLVFQEVSLGNLPLLEKQHWLLGYHLIPPKVNTVKLITTSKSCAVIFSRYSAVDDWQIYLYEHFAKYRRALVGAEVKDIVPSKDVKLVLAGTHLAHDVPRALVREQQLKEAMQLLTPYENVCLMGDLNILDEVDGELVLPSPWFDAWLSIPGHTHSKGYTVSLNTSPFASVRRRNGTSLGRLDRILCKLSDFKVKEVRVVGNKLTKSGILPSDHFGVFAVIKPIAKTNKPRKTTKTKDQVYFNRPPGWEKLIKN